jgi:hypothetical protein
MEALFLLRLIEGFNRDSFGTIFGKNNVEQFFKTV